MKLSPHQEQVLRFLFEKKDEAPSIEEICKAIGISESDARRTLTELEEMGMCSGPKGLLEQSADFLKEIEPELSATQRGYAEHIILAASVIAKANESFLASQLSYDREFVGLVGARLRSAGIWCGEEIAQTRIKAWSDSAISFFLDGAVAVGDLKVVGGTPDDPQYQMTEPGLKHAAKLLRRQ